MIRPCIALLTDFGLQDSYVGQMKGVIASINPAAIVIDVTHGIAPQQILQAAVTLSDAVDAFPPGTIHLIVVDPGVGSERRAIAAEIGPYRFVCPDNGLLSVLLKRMPLQRAVSLDQPRWWRSTVSGTFHGRDLFAPVAAAWSLGHDLSELGSPLVEPLRELTWPECQVVRSGDAVTVIEGQIVTIDHYGNLITNIPRSAIPSEAPRVVVQLAQHQFDGIVRCYADRPNRDCVALFGSSGRLEVAIVNGNAQQSFNACVGDSVIVRCGEAR